MSVMVQHQHIRRGGPLRTANENRHTSHDCNAFVKLEHHNCTAVYKSNTSVHTLAVCHQMSFCGWVCHGNPEQHKLKPSDGLQIFPCFEGRGTTQGMVSLIWISFGGPLLIIFLFFGVHHRVRAHENSCATCANQQKHKSRGQERILCCARHQQ